MPVAGDARAHLSVRSDPVGATVYVDGVAVGKTPLSDWSKDLGAQDQGTVKVVVVLDGYETARYPSVPLEMGKVQPLSVALKAIPASASGGVPSGGNGRTSTGNLPRLDPKYGELVEIPAGEFTMGSTSEEIDALLASDARFKREWFAGEIPQHRVYLDTYYIAKNVVTVQQYLAFCAATGREKPSAPDFNANWSKLDHPIVNVSWDDAVAYCAWLSKETGLKVSLPTEAEWEKAARGGDGRAYPWGDTFDSGKLQCSKQKVGDAGGTASVGSYPSGASPYGVLDMAGNVWQWCSDWYDTDYYKNSPQHNPPGAASGQNRLLRGGSWYSLISSIFRCAIRNLVAPENKDSVNGFRYVVH